MWKYYTGPNKKILQLADCPGAPCGDTSVMLMNKIGAHAPLDLQEACMIDVYFTLSSWLGALITSLG